MTKINFLIKYFQFNRELLGKACCKLSFDIYVKIQMLILILEKPEKLRTLHMKSK